MSEQQTPKHFGRYEVIRELGQGAMGVVYEGRDPVIGRRVALKTLRRDALADPVMGGELLERFLREARSAGALNHPNIITIYDADEQEGVAYIAMEYISSGTLRDFLARRGRLSPDEIVGIAASICRALHAAHEQGIVHRDIKPANIMLLPDGTAKVADFGIARVSNSELTQDGAMIGTPHFMSPEQFMAQKVDGRSDLFSVGVIVYEMLTGEKPFPGESVSAVMHKVLKVEPVEPQELNYAVPDALGKVVMKALAKRPADRYQNGKAMAASLLESVKESPDPAVLAIQAAAEVPSTILVDHDGRTIPSVKGIGPDASGAAPGAKTVITKHGERAASVSESWPDKSDSPDRSERPGHRWFRPTAFVALLAVIGLAAGIYMTMQRTPKPPMDTPSVATQEAIPEDAAVPSPETPIESDPDALEPVGAIGTPVVAPAQGTVEPARPPQPPQLPPVDTPVLRTIDIVTVCLADTREAYRRAMNDNIFTGPGMVMDGKVDVTVTDLNTGKVLLQENDVYAERLQLPEGSSAVKIFFSKEGYETRVEQPDPAVVGDTYRATVILAKSGLL